MNRASLCCMAARTRNKLGVPSRVVRNAKVYNIPDPVVRHVVRRDKSCGYCRLGFRIGARSRSNLASWEHKDRDSVNHPKSGTSLYVAALVIPAEAGKG